MKAARTEIYGPFEVLERLGVGGMASVHRAIERAPDGRERVVALKRLLPHLVEDEAFVRAFVREAKLASLLQHGNIVEIYELGRVGASYFISMEYIPGRDLRVIMRQARRVCGPPPIGIALSLIDALLDALDYAHRKRSEDGMPLGLVHRDISPSNLIISHAGDLKVIDFGIAKATLGYHMTHTGRVKGKLSYMAPEALAGQKVDGRSDLFSASVIAHELLTATPLFAAKDDFQIIERLQNMSPPPPSARNAACPHAIDEVVLRGLAKQPGGRWRSAADMRAALVSLAVGPNRLATRAEVCDWVEEAFEYQGAGSASSSSLSIGPTATPPTAASSYSRLPMRPPGARIVGARAADAMKSPSAAEEEIVDMVWGSGPPQMPAPVVLQDVPDVSRRPPPLESEAARDPHRSGSLTPHESTERLDQVALGTAPTAPQPSQELLVQAVSAARRAEALALAIVERQRPTLRLIAAALAVAAAGTAVAWFVARSGRSERQPVVAEAPPPVPPAAHTAPFAEAAPVRPPPIKVEALTPGQGAVLPPAAVSVAPPAAASVALPAAASAPSRAAAQAPATAPAPVGRAVAAGLGGAVAAGVDHGRRRDPGKRRGQREPPDRGHSVGAPEAVRESGIEAVGAVLPPSNDAVGTITAEDVSPAVEKAPAAEETGAARTQATQPVEQPAGPGSPRPRRKGPITVPASRTRRESGTIRPIHFPAGEQAPREIVAKLCIDPGGNVTSVTLLSRVSPGVRTAVERALLQWRYRPILDGDEKVAACFATSFPVQVE